MYNRLLLDILLVCLLVTNAKGLFSVFRQRRQHTIVHRYSANNYAYSHQISGRRISIKDVQKCGIQPKHTSQTLSHAHKSSSDQSDWPWMALIEIDNIFVCGGSLIHPRYVLSAAHCFCGYYGCGPKFVGENRITITLGKSGLTKSTKKEEKRRVTSYNIMPSFNINQRLNNDVAVLQLDSYSNYNYATICLPPPDIDMEREIVDNKCIVIGWKKSGTSDTTTDELQELNFRMQSRSTCLAIPMNPYFMHWEAKICAIGEQNHRTCAGNSGGPLMCRQRDNKWYVFGIVSHGPFDCSLPYPTVFTKVTDIAISDWIAKEVKR